MLPYLKVSYRRELAYVIAKSKPWRERGGREGESKKYKTTENRFNTRGRKEMKERRIRQSNVSQRSRINA